MDFLIFCSYSVSSNSSDGGSRSDGVDSGGGNRRYRCHIRRSRGSRHSTVPP